MGLGGGFVAGATGYTGRAIVQSLRARGARAIAHVRPDSARLEEWRARFAELGAEVDATPWDEAAMTSTLDRAAPDVIFAVLGTTRARARASADASRETYEAVDYGLTALLLRAAVATGRRPRFVYLSALAVSEESTSPYFRVRARLEGELRASGLPFTIVRPGFISGADRDDSRPMERVGAGIGDALLGAAAFFGAKRLRDRYASMDAATLGEAMVKVGLDPAGEGRVLEPQDLR